MLAMVTILVVGWIVAGLWLDFERVPARTLGLTDSTAAIGLTLKRFYSSCVAFSLS
jgi:hypothetical protein